MTVMKKSTVVGITAVIAVTVGLLITLLISSYIGDKDKENGDGSQPHDNSETDNTGDQEVSVPVNEDDWALYVIGNDDPLPEDFSIVTKKVIEERELDERCADYAIEMLKEAEKDGINLLVFSAYRSVQRQEENLQDYIDSLIEKGWSEEDAVIQAHREIALPGRSEHNAGLAMDIISDDYWFDHNELDYSFAELPHYEWLIENSWKYGFILSYPEGKEDITGFIYEPWHYRFVGLSHAERIHKIYEDTGEFLTVNEYIERYVD